MVRLRFFTSLHFKVASGVIATIVLTSSLYFIADYRSNRRQLLGELQESADQLARVSLQGLLELAMIGRHPELLQQAIERLGVNSSVRRIYLLDVNGQVRFSSDAADIGRRFSLQEEGCRICHEQQPPQRKSEFFELDREPILRNVTPVPNRDDCHGCHDPARRYNGVLVIDFPTGGVGERLRADFYETLGRAGVMVLLTLSVLGILMNKTVIIRLKKLSRAAGRLGGGAGSSPGLAALGGSDEIGQLAHSFEEMAGRVQSSIQKLQNQQGQLQDLMNSMPDGLIVVDREHRVEMTNSAADQIWDSPEPSQLLTDQAPFSEVEPALRETFRSGRLATCEVMLEADGQAAGAADRGPRYFEISCSPLRDDRNEVAKAILLVRDVTRRKTFEAQAGRAERLASVGRLAAGFAHEINNPLAAITTCVEGLSRHVAQSQGIEGSEKSEINDYLSTVGEAALRCKEITQKLLSASVEHDSTQLEPVKLQEVVQETLKLIEHQARQQGVDVASSPLADDLILMGNRRKLSQLLLNLLLNSLEALANSGRIEVSASRRGDLIALEVSDNGCGIPEESLECIFDPFFTTKTEGRGTGLGLSIAQSIVRQHNGRMHVASKPGQGATFSIFFPGLREGQNGSDQGAAGR